MKQIKNILTVFCVVALVFGPVFANDNNGCDNPDNDAITPELALCSTHAYNIGALTNPTGADKQLMRDVVAMKTTVITQQMYKQYEQMESMLRRLKTQLEKAVLTTGLQAKGASAGTSDSGGSGRFESNDRNVYIAGVRNCLNEYDDARILECYQNNLNTIVNSSGNGNNPTTELKKQLANDFKRLAEVEFGKESSCKIYLKGGSSYKDYCFPDKGKVKMTNSQFRECLDSMRSCLQNQNRAYKSSQKPQKN